MIDQWQYRGWSISFDAKPIPSRAFDWSATSPDYDCDCDQDGFFCVAGGVVHAATYKDLLIEIEDFIADSLPTASEASVPAGGVL